MERSADAVIVRSGTDQANFLFRAPASFRAAANPEAPFLVDLSNAEGEERARIRLRITLVAADDSRKPPKTLLEAREKEYREARKGEWKTSAEGSRARATLGDRTVLLVRDGTRMYELLLDGTAMYSAALKAVADGFTILDPKGGPVASQATPEDLKATKLEHDYYRLKVLKPEGFTREAVDPNADQGIWLHLRGEDEVRNLVEIKIRVFLSRTLAKTAEDRAQAAKDRFAKRYLSARVPKRPKRARWAGAKNAFQLKMAGKLAKTGLVVQEDYRLIDHENGRFYEIQVTTYAGAQRAFKKQLAAFWKNLKIRSK